MPPRSRIRYVSIQKRDRGQLIHSSPLIVQPEVVSDLSCHPNAVSMPPSIRSMFLCHDATSLNIHSHLLLSTGNIHGSIARSNLIRLNSIFEVFQWRRRKSLFRRVFSVQRIKVIRITSGFQTHASTAWVPKIADSNVNC